MGAESTIVATAYGGRNQSVENFSNSSGREESAVAKIVGR